MKEENVLPADFDGVFRFTNWTEEDFTAKWNNIEYRFPAQKMSPLIIPGETPEGVQSIRKKFAKELAEREFYKSERAKSLNALNPAGQTSFHSAVTYTENDLTPFVQKCLVPLPLAQVTAKVLPKADENSFRKDRKTGKNVTKVLDGSESLIAESGTVVA